MRIAIGIGADAVSDRAGIPAAKSERETGDAVGDPGLNDNRYIDLPAIRGEGDDVSSGQSKPRGRLGIERQRVAPYLLGQRLRTFLQPRIVGERAVPQAWIWPQHNS